MYRAVFSRVSRSVSTRSLLLISSSQKQHQLKSLVYEHPTQFAPNQVSSFHHSALNASPFQRFGFTSSVSPEPNEKQQEGSPKVNNDASTNAKPANTNGDAISDQKEHSVFEDAKESDSESDQDQAKDDLRKHEEEKEEILKLKDEEIERLKDKVLRSYAEMENVMERTKREAENSKKFAIQNFAKSLLDVADNLGRASSVVKDSFSKVDASSDTARVVPILKTLLEGVEMTEKQLAEVFKKFGVEKFDPTNEPFDPHRHYAVFQVPDASRPPGTVAHVLKAGYVLYDRVIRPAEVGVTQEVEDDAEANNKSD